MAKSDEPAGLLPRVKAAQRLRDVLSGSPFVPFTTAEIAGGPDRALANRLVNTALRRHGHIDLVLHDLLDRGMPKKSGSFEAVLRISLAQLLYLPDLGAHSAVFLAVEALKRDAKARHLLGLMNAALRRAQANAAQYWDLDPALSFPPSLQERWTKRYGRMELGRFGEALLDGAPLDLTLREDDPELVETLGGTPLFGLSVRVGQREKPVEQLPGYAEGKWWVQDVSTAVPARLLGRLSSGSSVLDMCAAPGGKTAQLAAAGYAVTALDADASRLDRLSENLRRLRLTAKTVVADGTSFVPAEPFDAILLDAPCTATGIFRRHPDVLLHRSVMDIADRVLLQQRLLANAVRMLKPGGILLYCVCSLEPEEGEQQVDWMRKNAPQMRFSAVVDAELPLLETAIQPAGTLRLYPGLRTEAPLSGAMDGFFVARFVLSV